MWPVEQGDYSAARALYEESVAIRRELGDRRGMAGVLGNLGYVAYELGDRSAARALSVEALAISRELGDPGRVADALNNLGNVAYDQGDFASARALHEEGLAIGRELGDRDAIATNLLSLGAVAFSRAILLLPRHCTRRAWKTGASWATGWGLLVRWRDWRQWWRHSEARCVPRASGALRSDCGRNESPLSPIGPVPLRRARGGGARGRRR